LDQAARSLGLGAQQVDVPANQAGRLATVTVNEGDEVTAQT